MLKLFRKTGEYVMDVSDDTILRLPNGNFVTPVRAGWSDKDFVIRDEADTIDKERTKMVCSRFQAKAALMQQGLLPQVEAALANADSVSKLAWAEAVEFRRNSPTIANLSALIGLTETQVDDLFRLAMTIEA